MNFQNKSSNDDFKTDNGKTYYTAKTIQQIPLKITIFFIFTPKICTNMQ